SMFNTWHRLHEATGAVARRWSYGGSRRSAAASTKRLNLLLELDRLDLLFECGLGGLLVCVSGLEFLLRGGNFVFGHIQVADKAVAGSFIGGGERRYVGPLPLLVFAQRLDPLIDSVD